MIIFQFELITVLILSDAPPPSKFSSACALLPGILSVSLPATSEVQSNRVLPCSESKFFPASVCSRSGFFVLKMKKH